MKLTRRRFIGYGAAGLVAALTTSGYSLAEPFQVSLERVSVRLPRLGPGLEGLKVAVLSDFHLQPFTKIEHIEAAVRLANTLQPDLVLLLGDYVDATVDAIDELAPVLARIHSRLGIFGVLGNHDHWKGPSRVRRSLRAAGITVLVNSGVYLETDGSQLFLAGIDSVYGHPDLKKTLAKHRADTPTILLAHEPDVADGVNADGRVGLQLSGHSHGGQVRIPLLGAISLPQWGERYDYGLYQLSNMQVYTNRGIGVADVPVRLNCPPELTLITLASR